MLGHWVLGRLVCVYISLTELDGFCFFIVDYKDRCSSFRPLVCDSGQVHRLTVAVMSDHSTSIVILILKSVISSRRNSQCAVVLRGSMYFNCVL